MKWVKNHLRQFFSISDFHPIKWWRKKKHCGISERKRTIKKSDTIYRENRNKLQNFYYKKIGTMHSIHITHTHTHYTTHK